MAQDNKILISTQTLRDTAQYVRDRNAKLESTLNDVRNKVTQLNNTWKSDAGEEIRRKITAFGNNHFNQYKEVVESYAKYLVTTADTYEALEGKTEGNAKSFQE